MTSQTLERIACPNCGRPIDLGRQTTSGQQVHCDACGGQFLLRGHVCPYCGAYHEQESQFCRQCGAALTRRCYQCQTINWIGDEYCAHCGAPMDIVDLVIRGHNVETQDRLYANMEEAQALKQQEASASNERLGRMMERERARQEALQQEMQARKEDERKMMQGLLIAVGVMLVIALLIAIF